MRLAIRDPWRRSAALVAACVVLAACGQGPTISTATAVAPGTNTATATPPPDIASPRGCHDLSPAQRAKRGLEIVGQMRDGEPFYALFDGVRSQIAAGAHITTYLRMPGARVVRLTLVGPDDRLVHVAGLRPGLAPYPWDRPGDPWTGTLTFPRSGCWRVYVDRAGDDGEAWLHVR
jgi:hypothetical protein